MQASQPEKMKRRVLAVGRVLVRKGFVMKEEDLGLSLSESLLKLQRKKKRKNDQGSQRLTRS